MADDVVRDVSSGYPASMRLSDRFNLERVSWGAIWAGVMVTMGVEALFLSFGIFIEAVIGGSTIWAMAWYLVTMGVSFFAGASSAARLSDVAVRDVRVLHGISTWGLATLGTAIIGGLIGWAAISRSTAPLHLTAIWGPSEEWAGLIWGGIVLSLITAFAGSAAAPRARTTAEQQAPSTPMRRVG